MESATIVPMGVRSCIATLYLLNHNLMVKVTAEPTYHRIHLQDPCYRCYFSVGSPDRVWAQKQAQTLEFLQISPLSNFPTKKLSKQISDIIIIFPSACLRSLTSD